MGKVEPGKSKIFYPAEVIKNNGPGVLVELKTNSGVVLFSKPYNWDEYRRILESVKGQPYWIGEGSQ
jgi:predicted nucleotide-binding protein (sugar kinase/HSP70/actin superfamily)